jgi:hypothetical protein
MVRKCEEIVAILKPFYEANLVSAFVGILVRTDLFVAAVARVTICKAML